MLVRCFWRDCRYRGTTRNAEPLDCFWVEATPAEAEEAIFPRLGPAAVSESKALAQRFEKLAERMSVPARPFCFLIARDLSTIDPFHVHYPIHQLWNAYSPFEGMPAKEIMDLDELRFLALPPSGPDEPNQASDQPTEDS
ncbi:MAG: hypothetical protein FJY88_08740 [Candidatus Eisenbacteria bacterium]|nr:hypothetical protein [Candidatus Eisenbacteria bacterium]